MHSLVLLFVLMYDAWLAKTCKDSGVVHAFVSNTMVLRNELNQCVLVASPVSPLWYYGNCYVPRNVISLYVISR